MGAMKTLLHLGTPEDADYQYRLAGLTAGSQVAWKTKLSTPATIRDLEDTIAKLPGGITGIVCSNQQFLEKLLWAQADFLPPNNRRGVTLDDYQGSMLFTPRDKIPVVFINPLQNLVTTTTAMPAAKRFISKLTDPGSFFDATPFTWELATPTNLPEYLARWEKHAAIISIDIETPIDNPLKTINCVGYAAYFPATHTTECLVIPFDSSFNLEFVLKFNNLPQPKVMQNGLYDSVYFMRFNAPIFNWLYDTQHLFHSMYSEYPKRLDFITAYAIRNVRYWKDDGKSGNLTDYYRYNAKDCWATLNSFLALLLIAEPYAIKNYLKEFPLVFPCLHCELEGFKVDVERMAVVKALKEQEVLVKEKALLTSLAAPNFNLNSPQQVKELFKVLGVGHLPSTDADNMLKAQAAHPLNNRILSALVEVKKAKKLINTYFVEGKFWNGRLYYKLNPAGTDTGRLASSESSFWCGLQIQNIPRGDSVKQCIVSDSGWLLCEIDKAQSEARCVAYLSGDTALLQLVESSHDYHSWNAAAFFGVPYERIYDEATGKQLDKVLRDLAKRVNHGANYNMGANVMLDTMGPKKVAEAKVTLKLSGSLRQVCEHLLSIYERTYPRVKGLWYDSIIKEVSLTARLVSPRGWTRIFFGKPSRQNKPALNAAVAHPGQNLSVDIINEEFYNVWHAQVYNFYYKDGKKTAVLLRDVVRVKAQIHDSVIFQYRAANPGTPKVVEQIMRTTTQIKGADGVTRQMFIPSEISAGKERWSELK
jgi:DNA polymerase I-like protein with 3'-5' exonuclease and polymerase domains